MQCKGNKIKLIWHYFFYIVICTHRILPVFVGLKMANAPSRRFDADVIWRSSSCKHATLRAGCWRVHTFLFLCLAGHSVPLYFKVYCFGTICDSFMARSAPLDTRAAPSNSILTVDWWSASWKHLHTSRGSILRGNYSVSRGTVSVWGDSRGGRNAPDNDVVVGVIKNISCTVKAFGSYRNHTQVLCKGLTARSSEEISFIWVTLWNSVL